MFALRAPFKYGAHSKYCAFHLCCGSEPMVRIDSNSVVINRVYAHVCPNQLPNGQPL